MKKYEFRNFITGFMSLCIIILFTLVSCANMKEASKESGAVQSEFAGIAEKWGIEPLVIRMTGSDHFLDFRYRVVDAEKARPVLKKQTKAYLKNTETGKIYSVPVTKIGPMRSSADEPKPDKQYFILFGNSDKSIQQGSHVTVIIGECQVDGMVVE